MIKNCRNKNRGPNSKTVIADLQSTITVQNGMLEYYRKETEDLKNQVLDWESGTVSKHDWWGVRFKYRKELDCNNMQPKSDAIKARGGLDVNTGEFSPAFPIDCICKTNRCREVSN